MGLDMSTLFLDCTRRGNVGDLTKAPEVFKRQALLASLPQLAKYRRTYTVAQIAANLAKVAPEGTDYAMYAAAEKGDATELLNLVELWFAHPVLNDCSGWGFTGDSTPLMVAC